jgi:hypothetical protein
MTANGVLRGVGSEQQKKQEIFIPTCFCGYTPTPKGPYRLEGLMGHVLYTDRALSVYVPASLSVYVPASLSVYVPASHTKLKINWFCLLSQC